MIGQSTPPANPGKAKTEGFDATEEFSQAKSLREEKADAIKTIGDLEMAEISQKPTSSKQSRREKTKIIETMQVTEATGSAGMSEMGSTEKPLPLRGAGKPKDKERDTR